VTCSSWATWRARCSLNTRPPQSELAFNARLACDVARGVTPVLAPHIEDGLLRLLFEAGPLSAPERVERIILARLFGLLPWALGLAPARRIVINPSALLSENRGIRAALGISESRSIDCQRLGHRALCAGSPRRRDSHCRVSAAPEPRRAGLGRYTR
jgi:hypothetical protein